MLQIVVHQTFSFCSEMEFLFSKDIYNLHFLIITYHILKQTRELNLSPLLNFFSKSDN